MSEVSVLDVGVRSHQQPVQGESLDSVEKELSEILRESAGDMVADLSPIELFDSDSDDNIMEQKPEELEQQTNNKKNRRNVTKT